jgi:predicted flap endonuclease-1-like 5' DNA nuclease
MSKPMKGMSCTMGCWAMAGAIGALAFVLLILGETSWTGSIFLAGLATGVLGLMFSFLFCRDLPGPVRAGSAPTAPSRSAQTAPARSAPAAAVKPAPTAAAPTKTASAPSQVSDAKPDVSTASASADAEAGAAVKPSKALGGEDDLKSRKGSWKYEGDKPATTADASTEDDAGSKPATLAAARADGADDLKKIKGIGPKLEELCNSMGFYHFDQIAAWTPAEVAWVDQNLEGFKGRVTRDEWVPQAKSLSSGEETEFSKRVDKGDVY